MTENTLRELGGAIAEVVEIRDVRLTRGMTESQQLTDDLLDGDLDVSTRITTSARRRAADELNVRATYDVAAVLGEHALEEESPDPAWRVRATFVAVLWVSDRDREFTEDELKGYAVNQGLAVIHPFVREYMQSTTTRLGYPAFTLPFLPAVNELEESSAPE